MPTITLPSGGGAVYQADAPPILRLSNASLVAQSPAATVRTYLAGSALAIPLGGRIAVGSCFRWTFSMTKTAAGSALSTIDVAIGTTGTVADVARLSFTKPAGTAAVDEAVVEVLATCRAAGSSGVLVGEFSLIHNLSATGHAVIPCVCVNAISASFDLSAPVILGVCLTSGAADAITIQQVVGEGWGVSPS